MDNRHATVATVRYNKKKEAIIAAAAGILNRRGVRGMTLADVAASVDLITTSVTYYFKKKEDLASACFLRGLERLETLVVEAAAEPNVSARLLTLIDRYLDLRRRIAAEEAAPIPVFSDIRALTAPHQAPVVAAYRDLFLHI